MKVGVIDYGLGNLGSVRKAFAAIGAEAVIVAHPEQLSGVARLVLPGVGSFADGMARLRAKGWPEALRRQVLEAGTPLLGICLGMQLLATEGCEGGTTVGLDLIPGCVRRLDHLGCPLRIPHAGWNDLTFPSGGTVPFIGIPAGTDFYFVHSYALVPDRKEQIVAHTDYGIPVVAAVRAGAAWGTQFHPEKSSRAGLQLLSNFLDPGPC